MKGGAQPIVFSAVLMTLCSAFRVSAAAVSYAQSVREHTLDGTMIKVKQQVFWNMVLSVYSQKIQPPLCLLQQLLRVGVPDQIICQLNAQKPEHWFPLHTGTTNEEWLDVSLVFSLVNNKLLYFCGVEEQLHLVPVCQLTLLGQEESHHCQVICELYGLVAMVVTQSCVEGVKEQAEHTTLQHSVVEWRSGDPA